MKKFIISVLVIAGFSIYAVFNRINVSQVYSLSDNTSATVPPTQIPTPTKKPVPTVTSIPATPSPTTVPRGQYVDGEYTGDSVDVYYGNIQVKAFISGGKLTNVQFLDYPQDRSHSVQISKKAMPILTSEAIKNQSAKVNAVSGATETSKGFVQSLGSALAKAK
ncbi:MAG: FMN-binding protein [Candidatus Taylorbacteria bacterium]|nr:FMN-binding protein [Candidatus Taylorbacteria bacterium]